MDKGFEQVQRTNNYTKRCFTSFVTRKIQIKITMRYYYAPLRMVKIKETEAPNVGRTPIL